MAVVKYPHLHFPLFCFIQNDIHVIPPSGAAEIRVGPAFHAHSPYSASVNRLHVFPKNLLLLAVLPEERKNIIAAFIFQ